MLDVVMLQFTIQLFAYKLVVIVHSKC